eukprot:symbB.v1.2.023702.t1/scaffold2183.1/size166057/6
MLVELPGKVGSDVWLHLHGRDVVQLSYSSSNCYHLALQLLPQRLTSSPFALLSRGERAEVLRFLPMMEEALLFENFAHWDPAKLLEDVQQKLLPVSGVGSWCLGPGTEVPPRLQRVVRGISQQLSLCPLGHWCVCLSNEDPLTDYGPSGLVYTLPSHCHPCFLAYRCKASAFRPHRAGGVLALTYGLGNDKGPERPAVLMSFVRDGNSREILAAKSWSSEPLASWNDGEWLTLILRLDWKKRNMEIIVKGSHQQVQKQVPFANVECDAVKYLVLYNHTGDRQRSTVIGPDGMLDTGPTRKEDGLFHPAKSRNAFFCAIGSHECACLNGVWGKAKLDAAS